eukprot:TRINITY_DN220_c1_g6_i1.p1 TRINITY_DN220_c1_g6~~TRINITY_DN220_c1_g6_i1.p1  ORF type:complete len:1456 (+),score=457.57 TRINITY_DN220_c1_g6_i1:284-4369(+)
MFAPADEEMRSVASDMGFFADFETNSVQSGNDKRRGTKDSGVLGMTIDGAQRHDSKGNANGMDLFDLCHATSTDFPQQTHSASDVHQLIGNNSSNQSEESGSGLKRSSSGRSLTSIPSVTVSLSGTQSMHGGMKVSGSTATFDMMSVHTPKNKQMRHSIAGASPMSMSMSMIGGKVGTKRRMQMFAWGHIPVDLTRMGTGTEELKASVVMDPPLIESPSKKSALALTPRELIGPVRDITQICHGEDSILMLTKAGEVYEGKHDNGSGFKLINAFSAFKALTQNRKRVIRVANGNQFSLALTSSGEVYSWGNGKTNCLGHGSIKSQDHPRQILGLIGYFVREISCGPSHCAAVCRSSSGDGLYTWGKGSYGRLGHGNERSQLEPKRVDALKRVSVKTVSCGEDFTCCADNNCQIWTFGNNCAHQCGIGSNEPSIIVTPRKIALKRLVDQDSAVKDSIRSVACGLTHSLILLESGCVFSFGNGEVGQLGACATVHSLPTKVPMSHKLASGDKIVSICTGRRHCIAVSQYQTVLAWGDGRRGALGLGHTLAVPTPEAVSLPQSREIGAVPYLCCGDRYSVVIFRSVSEDTETEGVGAKRFRYGSPNRGVNARKKKSMTMEKRIEEWDKLLKHPWSRLQKMPRFDQLWKQGLPACLRGKLWPAAIGNALRINPEMYLMYRQRVKFSKEVFEQQQNQFENEFAAGDVSTVRSMQPMTPNTCPPERFTNMGFRERVDNSQLGSPTPPPTLLPKMLSPARPPSFQTSNIQFGVPSSSPAKDPQRFMLGGLPPNRIRTKSFDKHFRIHSASFGIPLQRRSSMPEAAPQSFSESYRQHIAEQTEDDSSPSSKHDSLNGKLANFPDLEEFGKLELRTMVGVENADDINNEESSSEDESATESEFDEDEIDNNNELSFRKMSMKSIIPRAQLSTTTDPTSGNITDPGEVLVATPIAQQQDEQQQDQSQQYQEQRDEQKHQQQHQQDQEQDQEQQYQQQAHLHITSTTKIEHAPSINNATVDGSHHHSLPLTSSSSLNSSTSRHSSLKNLQHSSTSTHYSQQQQQHHHHPQLVTSSSYNSSGLPPPPPSRRMSMESRLSSSHMHSGSYIGASDMSSNGSVGQDPLSLTQQVFNGREASMHLVSQDLPRTFASLQLFAEEGPFYDQLLDVLETFACFRPDLGYVQGMTYMAAVLCLYLPSTYAVFQSLSNLVLKHHLFAFYSMNQPLLQQYYSLFNRLLRLRLPDLVAHFEEEGIETSVFLYQWFQTIFLPIFPLEIGSRILDHFFQDGSPFLFSVALAILDLLSPFLLKHPIEVCMPLIQTSSEKPSEYDVLWNKEIYNEKKLFQRIRACSLPTWALEKISDFETDFDLERMM